MRITLLYIFFLGLTISAAGQERVRADADKQPYILVDTFIVDLKSLVLSPGKIESVDVLKDSSATVLYGDKAKFGVVIIKTKPNTKMLRIADIIAKYNVSKADQKLRICINKTLISRPELLLIEENEILNVELTTDKHWINPEDASSTERVINITTSQPGKSGS